MTDPQLLYRPPDGWFGDVMPIHSEGVFHLFYTFLHRDDLGGENVLKGLDWAHVTTRDFTTFQPEPMAIRRGSPREADLLVGAGSVVRDDDGTWVAFYGGINPSRSAAGHAEQVVLRATSRDLVTWEKDPSFALEADPRWYERHDWRDPFVYRDGSGWRMLVCARVSEAAAFDRRGCFGAARSADLRQWDQEPPMLWPGTTRAPECPEVFELDGRWYLLYSTYSDRFATRYRIGDGPAGPWRRPAWDSIDSNDAYAFHSVSDGRRRLAIGWVSTRAGDRDGGHRQWGGDLVVHELTAGPDGTLRARPTDGLIERFAVSPAVATPRRGEWQTDGDQMLFSGAGFGWCSFGSMRATSLIDLTVDVGDAEELGVALHATQGFDAAYLLRLEPARGRFVFDRRPHRVDVPFDQDSDRSYVSAPDFEIERPLTVVDGRVHVRVIVDGSAILAYVNDVALSTRGYDLAGGEAGFYAANGRTGFSGLRTGEVRQRT